MLRWSNEVEHIILSSACAVVCKIHLLSMYRCTLSFKHDIAGRWARWSVKWTRCSIALIRTSQWCYFSFVIISETILYMLILVKDSDIIIMCHVALPSFSSMPSNFLTFPFNILIILWLRIQRKNNTRIQATKKSKLKHSTFFFFRFYPYSYPNLQ